MDRRPTHFMERTSTWRPTQRAALPLVALLLAACGEGASDIPNGDGGPVGQCGDSTCSVVEDCDICSADCGLCSTRYVPSEVVLTTNSAWTNIAMSEPAAGQLTFAGWIRVGAEDIDALVAVADQPVREWAQSAIAVRFNAEGAIDARNGDVYEAEQAISYVAEEWYRVLITADVPARTYTVRVAKNGQAPQTLVSGASFRTSAGASGGLSHVALWTSSAADIELADVTWTAGVCEPQTCDSLGQLCGMPDDGCGGTLECGSCSGDDICDSSGRCGPGGGLEGSVSQYGITWTFDGPHTVGRYVTGGWWVLGPVTVTSVSPGPTGTRNGSMVNPVDAQAYDSRGGKYEGDKGASFPLALAPGNSLVSSISHPNATNCTRAGGAIQGWSTYDGYCNRGPIRTQAVLTVVASQPPTDAFRPPYSGSNKPEFAASEVCWERLPKLAPPPGTPPTASVLRHMQRPWIDHLGSWQMQHGCASENMYCYGRELGQNVSTVSVFALLDTPAQREATTQLIQLGIDNYGVVQAGGQWGVDGGHFNGRKWPIVFAGMMLGDQGMESPGVNIGNEDRVVYEGSDGKARWGRPCTSCFTATCSYPSSCRSGAKDCRDPSGMTDACPTYRLNATSPTWVGEALAARLLGAEQMWGNDTFFRYVDRWMAGDVSGGGSALNTFVNEMWDRYRNISPSIQTCR